MRANRPDTRDHGSYNRSILLQQLNTPKVMYNRNPPWSSFQVCLAVSYTVYRCPAAASAAVTTPTANTAVTPSSNCFTCTTSKDAVAQKPCVCCFYMPPVVPAPPSPSTKPPSARLILFGVWLCRVAVAGTTHSPAAQHAAAHTTTASAAASAASSASCPTALQLRLDRAPHALERTPHAQALHHRARGRHG
eukprot:XP_001696774.1 predicted protein [Chlamydomonas reinhardtii]